MQSDHSSNSPIQSSGGLPKSTAYQKHHSFNNFVSDKKGVIEYQSRRALRVADEYLSGKLQTKHAAVDKLNFREIIESVRADLREQAENEVNAERICFRVTQFIAEEMMLYDDAQLLRFLYHRYRYDLYPRLRKLDEYPPYVQIEPTSICNFRCVFCYQTDLEFFSKKSGSMGSMTLDQYKAVVDQIEGHVEFLSLASRGEPMVAKEIDGMLKYSVGKFLNLKVNTNASLLNEKHIHALLSGGVRTVVFSADAADEELYAKLRVNGKLDRVLKNIELFQNIREKEYSNLKVLTRVSGVRVSEEQSIQDMEKLWGKLVDQIAFVNYNPWENIYSSEPNNIKKPCSDLWRRMFVWFDGKVNPCDSDYKSALAVGNINETSVPALWSSEHYQKLRGAHEAEMRNLVEPCKRCAVT